MQSRRLLEINRTIPRNMRGMVEEVCEDSSCFEVVLKDGFINVEYGETMWIFNKSHLEHDMTVLEMVQDLSGWLQGVEEDVTA